MDTGQTSKSPSYLIQDSKEQLAMSEDDPSSSDQHLVMTSQARRSSSALFNLTGGSSKNRNTIVTSLSQPLAESQKLAEVLPAVLTCPISVSGPTSKESFIAQATPPASNGSDHLLAQKTATQSVSSDESKAWVKRADKHMVYVPIEPQEDSFGSSESEEEQPSTQLFQAKFKGRKMKTLTRFLAKRSYRAAATSAATTIARAKPSTSCGSGRTVAQKKKRKAFYLEGSTAEEEKSIKQKSEPFGISGSEPEEGREEPIPAAPLFSSVEEVDGGNMMHSYRSQQLIAKSGQSGQRRGALTCPSGVTKRRKIPGPVGELLPRGSQGVGGAAVATPQPPKLYSRVLGISTATRLYERKQRLRLTSSQQGDSNQRMSKAWKLIKTKYADMRTINVCNAFRPGHEPSINLAWIKHHSRALKKEDKIPFLLVKIVSLFDPGNVDKLLRQRTPAVWVKDDSGTVLAALSPKATRAFGTYLSRGTALALKKVRVLHLPKSPVLVVSRNSIANIIAEDVQISSQKSAELEGISSRLGDGLLSISPHRELDLGFVEEDTKTLFGRVKVEDKKDAEKEQPGGTKEDPLAVDLTDSANDTYDWLNNLNLLELEEEEEEEED